ncbi:DUF1330 domain-containing protein [Fontimonas sp. SYSU GA230001]|uniref:DUF1330 domain-containing protein n=1 Tax=Fontimonas sp. SYSU GA230001 TaxID=3142450 RepID=UPI0032B54150
MTSVDLTPERFKHLFERVPADTPLTMLNLLRFREVAAYAAERGLPACTGAAAYAAYSRAVLPLLQRVGARVVWNGRARHTVIGPADEQWDEVLLVEYPSVAAFAQMVKSAEYQAIYFHRAAALRDSRLIATVAGS